jgi:hypothetical protein
MKLFPRVLFFLMLILSGLSCSSQVRSPLFFREDWKEIEAALPVTQEHVANAELVLSLYGPGADQVKKSNHPLIPNDPYYIWSGECKANWALTLRHSTKFVDLSGESAAIRFRSRQSGFRQLHVILKLQDGTWLVGDHAAGYTQDWSETKLIISNIRWRKLSIEDVIEGAVIEKPNLTSVVEIGFTDLMRGGGTPASSRLDWIEVYGKAVPPRK